MEFAWDPAKSDENYRLRGFDFAFATLIFLGPTLEKGIDAMTTASGEQSRSAWPTVSN